MNDLIITADSTSVSIDMFLRDPSTNGPYTGLAPTAVWLNYSRSRTASSSAQGAAFPTPAVTDAYNSGKVIEKSATLHPGIYRVDWPNEAFAAGSDSVILMITDAASAGNVLAAVKVNLRTVAATGNWATAGAEMDLVDAPNEDAIAAIKTGLAGAEMDLVDAPNEDAIAAIKTGLAGLGTYVTGFIASALTETAPDRVVEAFKQFFDVENPTGTVNVVTVGANSAADAAAYANSADGKIPDGLADAIAHLDLDISAVSPLIVTGPPIIVDSEGQVMAANAGSGAPTVEEIRTEMDDNSTKLANLDMKISEVGAGSAPTVVEIREEMDANSVQLAKIDDITGLQGDGSVTVDHNTGGTDHLTYQYEGVGVSGGVIRAYLKSEYDANTIDEKGMAYTGASGRWTSPMYLDPGTYYLVFTKPGVYGPTIVTEIIA